MPNDFNIVSPEPSPELVAEMKARKRPDESWEDFAERDPDAAVVVMTHRHVDADTFPSTREWELVADLELGPKHGHNPYYQPFLDKMGQLSQYHSWFEVVPAGAIKPNEWAQFMRWSIELVGMATLFLDYPRTPKPSPHFLPLLIAAIGRTKGPLFDAPATDGSIRCPSCEAHTVLPTRPYEWTSARLLACESCGYKWDGTDAEVAASWLARLHFDLNKGEVTNDHA